MLKLSDRPLRRDRQDIVHIGSSWTASWWEPLCEAHMVEASRNTDEPEGTTPTCLLCWVVVFVGFSP